GVSVLWVDGQVIFDLLQMLREDRKPGGFLVVAQVHVSLIGRFVAEEFVVVSLVWPNRDVQRRVQVPPRHIALVIVVGKKCIGTQAEKFLQRCVVGQAGRVAKQAGGARQIIRILLAVRNG